jgi:integrase
MAKEDVLNYLNSLRKPELQDPTHRWIGSYNARQMIFLKFFRWLYNRDESDVRKRITPPSMQGIRRLPRKEKSPYKPSDLWTEEEHAIFLKYCPSKRDKAFHAMANDTSARPHELLNLKINDIVFKKAENGIQYAEVLVCGKTKSRTLPLISSILM